MSRNNQPFECDVCHSRFTRHENLKRHAGVHSRPKDDASFSCHLCRTNFSRRDLRERHYKRKHAGQHENAAQKKAARRDTVASVHEAPQLDMTLSQWHGEAYDSMNDATWEELAKIGLPQSQHHRTQYAGGWTAPYASTAACAPILPGTGMPTRLPIPDVSPPQLDSTNSLVGNLVELSPPPSLVQSHNIGLPGPAASPTPSISSRAASATRSQSPSVGSPPYDLAYSSIGWYPSFYQIARGLELYFAHVSHFVPFLHRPTFDPQLAPRHLILALLSQGYQHGEDPDLAGQPGSGERLAVSCFHHGRLLCATIHEEDDGLTHNLTLVQTLLLLEICAMMHVCGNTSKYGLKMHWRMVSVARSAGFMTMYSPQTMQTRDLDDMWRESVKAESLKRTILTAHQVDALWYHFLSVPRSLSHLEIKHELPQPIDCWDASSAAEWAHSRLVMTQSKPPVQYTDAVRRYLSCSPETESIPPFDPFGAINIAHFLLSSAREVSGWSAMTGQLSLERFEALRASLVTLAPSLCPQGETAVPSHAATRAATWEMAMIEFFIWSPAHTSGIVEANLDAMLSRSTQHARSSKLNFSLEVVAAIQPHLDWFLRYLNDTVDVAGEAPWVALYAYRAFLLAWQLLREGTQDAMAAIKLRDGDADAAVRWARGVFKRRGKWQLSKLVMQQIELLSNVPCT